MVFRLFLFKIKPHHLRIEPKKKKHLILRINFIANIAKYLVLMWHHIYDFVVLKDLMDRT